MKRNKSNEVAAKVFSLQENRINMNYWRHSLSTWKSILGEGNRNKSAKVRSLAMANINRARNELRLYMGAVEIQLGMI